MQNYRTSRPRCIAVSTDVDACTEDIKSMLDAETLERVGRDLDIPVDDVGNMTYGQIASRIAANYEDENRGKEAADAMWCLAAPYISVWKKRGKKK